MAGPGLGSVWGRGRSRVSAFIVAGSRHRLRVGIDWFCASFSGRSIKGDNVCVVPLA